MISEENLKTIKKIIEEFFKKMTFEVEEIEYLPQADGILSINIKTKEPQILIGEKGEVLLAIQHLLKIILKRKTITQTQFYLDIDINDYKKKKINYLKEIAKSFAQEVILTRKEKILPPMPAYERRIIHLELADNPNITTESIGQEPERRIIIKPYPQT